ncbi:MAG: hypothetical protein ABI039_03145 [Vicinamibacterales bacterium]
MTRVAAAAIVLSMMGPAAVTAHGLDEYLQAARVSFDRSALTLEIDLAPGVNVAGDIIRLIDRDGDLAVSPAEAELYGRRVLSDVSLTLDGNPLIMTLTRIEVPATGEMRDGLGTVQLRATARISPAVSERRVLYLSNRHLSESSVYLVNALLPEDRDIEVVKQVRDPRQSSISIEYRIAPSRVSKVSWALIGVFGLSGLVAFRTTER